MPSRPPEDSPRNRRAPIDPGDSHRAGTEASPPVDDWRPEDDLGEPEVAEAVGPSLEDAIANALEILGAREDEVEIEVLEQGHRAFLGLGKSRPFRVRATWREDDEEVIEEEVEENEVEDEEEAEPLPLESLEEDSDESDPDAEAPSRRPMARQDSRYQEVAPPPSAPSPASRPQSRGRVSPDVLTPPPTPVDVGGALDESLAVIAARAQKVTEEILGLMGIDGRIQTSHEGGEVLVQIESEDDALLIGRRGETRAAFQHILQRLVTSREEAGIPVLVDVNGYWERRMDKLRQEAQDLAEQAVRRGQEVHTEPLSAQERRVIHRALADHSDVTTESIGSGPLKRVAVIPETRS